MTQHIQVVHPDNPDPIVLEPEALFEGGAIPQDEQTLLEAVNADLVERGLTPITARSASIKWSEIGVLVFMVPEFGK